MSWSKFAKYLRLNRSLDNVERSEKRYSLPNGTFRPSVEWSGRAKLDGEYLRDLRVSGRSKDGRGPMRGSERGGR